MIATCPWCGESRKVHTIPASACPCGISKKISGADAQSPASEAAQSQRGSNSAGTFPVAGRQAYQPGGVFVSGPTVTGFLGADIAMHATFAACQAHKQAVMARQQAAEAEELEAIIRKYTSPQGNVIDVEAEVVPSAGEILTLPES